MAGDLLQPGTGRRRRGRGARAPMSAINVTPMVDVMLVLLVIFMVTAPLLKAGIPIALPDSRAKPLDETPHQVVIAIDRTGAVFLDDAPVGADELPARINALPRGADGALPLVTLRADRGLDYGRVIAVMGDLNHAGITRIALVTLGTGAGPGAKGAAGDTAGHVTLSDSSGGTP